MDGRSVVEKEALAIELEPDVLIFVGIGCHVAAGPIDPQAAHRAGTEPDPVAAAP